MRHKFNLSNRVALKFQNSVPVSVPKPEEKNPAPEEQRPAEKRPLTVTSRTDTGLVRRNNQDAVIQGSGLLGIADGMGGHNGGETASAGAREGMLQALEGREPSEEALEEAISQVNLALYNRQLEDASLSGMGTTLTVLWPAEDRMLIGHVGDSRAYLLREGHLRQVTQDHSMVADMVRRGLLTEEQASTHPMRNYITRAVGTEPTIRADILSLERQAGDQWLVCSDGLHGLLSREDLEELMAEPNLEEAADEMLRLALDRGGRDNISLLLAREEQAGEVAE